MIYICCPFPLELMRFVDDDFTYACYTYLPNMACALLSPCIFFPFDSKNCHLTFLVEIYLMPAASGGITYPSQ